MKTIKIKFCDFSKDLNPEDNDFVNILREKYNVELSDSPDYVFYSMFGYDHLKYNCVRIFFTGECIVPDFNICDYAIGFDYLDFGDRYLRWPLYKLFQYRKSLITAVRNRNTDAKKGFCGFVVSNDNGMKERSKIFEMLCQYKKVASGGRYCNNVGGPVKDKHEFLSNYKFSIAFENCCQTGYTTEKIVEAFAAGNIPIYFGNKLIAEEFNDKAFINCHDYSDLQKVYERVVEIEQNEELYLKILSEPIADKDLLDQTDLRYFLFTIFDQAIDQAKRRPNNTYTREHEEKYKFIASADKMYFLQKKRIKGLLRRIKNRSL